MEIKIKETGKRITDKFKAFRQFLREKETTNLNQTWFFSPNPTRKDELKASFPWLVYSFDCKFYE